MNLHSPFGLVAGNGSFPVQIAAEVKRQGIDVIAVAHVGETDPKIAEYCSKIVWIKVGQLGKLIKTFLQNGVKEAVFSGGISRVKLFGGFRPDLKAIALIARAGSVRDDVILRAVAGELEKRSIKVLSPSIILPQCVVNHGLLTKRGLNEQERIDAAFGWTVAKSIGQLDIGQTVVVSDGLVVAVECVEGTDEAILRAGVLTGPKSCTVIKVAKPQQDERLDLPGIGIKTIESMKEANASALVLEDQKALMLEPDEVIRVANSLGIAIVVLRNNQEL